MTKAGLYKLVTKPHIFIKDYTKKNTKVKKQVKIYAEKAIELPIPFHGYYYILYKKFNEGKAFPLAEKALFQAISLKETTKYYYLLINLLKRKNQWWQMVEIYEKALAFDRSVDIKFYIEYVNALAKMNRFEKIVEVLTPLFQKKQLDSDGYFKYAHALKQIGRLNLAEEAFNKAIKLDTKNNSEKLGLGIFYEKKGEWIPAKRAYEKSLVTDFMNPLLRYKYGLALERCYSWKDSEEEHLTAIALEPIHSHWFYKLGFVRERIGDYEGAVEAYAFAIDMKKTSDRYLYYRLGYVLKKLERYEESCIAFLKMKNISLSSSETTELKEDEQELAENNSFLYTEFPISLKEYASSIINIYKKNILKDTTNVENWLKLAQLCEREREYLESADAFKYTIERNNDFDENLYFSLGHVLAFAGKYKEASESFIEYRILQDAHGVLETPYNKNRFLRKTINYTEYYERYEIEENIILYESYHGRSISCNPYALFKEIYSDERFKDYKHVWAINDFTIIPENLKCNINIIFVKRESDLYLRYLTKAKYLINNTSFSDYFIRKDGQIYLNTWHGTPLKLMGKDAKDEFLSHKNIARNFLQTTHLTHPNKYTLEIMLESYDIENIYGGSVSKVGYPRQDLMLNITEKERQNILNSMNIDKNKKVILYAPTWRGTGISDIDFDLDKLVEDLNILTKLDDVHILYRGHYMAEKFIQKVSTLQDMIVPSSIDTNSLLSTVDILITDYSSIAFDFMAMKKPIIYYVYDKDKYVEERGLKFDIAEISENLCKNNQELFDLLNKLIINPKLDKKQINATNVFCPYDDGYASKRVVDLLFFNKIDKKYQVEINKKESILFYGGTFTPYGITTSLLNLLSNIDREKYNINIALEPNVIKNDHQKTEQLNRLPKDVSLIGKFGRMNVTLEEKWILDKFNSQRELASLEMWNILYNAYKREFLRIFGHTKFDYVINFEGYNQFWVRLFAQKNSSLYLHNDMLGEAEEKYSGLFAGFKVYNKYDNLISVSFDVDKANKENLSQLYNIPIEKFKYCNNLLNPQEVITKSNKDLESNEDERLFNKKGKVFINMARLSPEKDQEKLIYAFAKIVKKHSDSKLIILGQGPLEGALKSLVKKLAMQKHIFILGQRFNPMPYLKRMDCFVLSSNYEGQGLVLLEAMILGKPVISTDIVGPRSVLKDGLGLLVENSEDSLYTGMLDFLEGRYKVDKKFDYEKYNQNAMNMFYKIVLNKEEYDAN